MQGPTCQTEGSSVGILPIGNMGMFVIVSIMGVLHSVTMRKPSGLKASLSSLRVRHCSPLSSESRSRPSQRLRRCMSTPSTLSTPRLPLFFVLAPLAPLATPSSLSRTTTFFAKILPHHSMPDESVTGSVLVPLAPKFLSLLPPSLTRPIVYCQTRALLIPFFYIFRGAESPRMPKSSVSTSIGL
jgi:hypothetical protein